MADVAAAANALIEEMPAAAASRLAAGMVFVAPGPYAPGSLNTPATLVIRPLSRPPTRVVSPQLRALCGDCAVQATVKC